MPSFVAFLRAVNIGKRKYPMAELRAALEAAGFTGVQTHIQTGNVLLTTPRRSAAKVAEELEQVFEADRGWPVVTVVLTPAELEQIADDIDQLGAEHQPRYGHYVSLLKHDPADAEALEGASLEGERLVVRGRAVHLLYDVPYGEAKTSNAFIEKASGVAATNRNAKVIKAMREKWT